jgi:2-dehydropantoate 2-reductase
MGSAAEGHLSPILVVGTGALATLFAARLAAAGHPVSMLGTWATGLQALQQEGARLVDPGGRQHAYQVHATHDPREVQGIPLALVLVKAWQTADAGRRLSLCLPSDGLALTLQNGIGNREILAQSLGQARVAVGTTTTGATLLGPGLVRAGGEGLISLEQHRGAGQARQSLKSAGFAVRTVRDARSLLWGKLVINAAINPLTALLRVNNGELLKRPSARCLMAGLAQEVAAVAAAENIILPFKDAVSAAEGVARRTAANRSSMFQDIQRGTPTEIDAICGAVAQHGAIHDVPTPLNYTCWQLVSALASGR